MTRSAPAGDGAGDTVGGIAEFETLFVDTNIPMYVHGSDAALRRESVAALRHAVERRIRLVTSAEVLQEVLHRYFSIRSSAKGEAVYRFVSTLCREVLPVEQHHTERALELLLRHRGRHGFSARDALHAAVMEEFGIRGILSKDRAFDLIPTIRRIDPADLAAAG